jgi:hypothetical protein
MAMSERDTGYPASSGFSASTENAASGYDSPDASGSTAEFRAFASRSGEPDSPWRMRATGRQIALLAAVVIVVAIVLAVIAINVLNS